MDDKTAQKKSDRTRQRLTEAALSMMKERGYQGVTIRDICVRVGVSVGTFYRYFETKSDVLREMYAAGDALMQAEDPALAGRTWTERIMTFVAKYARLNIDTGLDGLRVLYNPENTWFTQTRPMQRKLSELFSGAQAVGELTDNASVEEMTELFFVCMRGICYDWCISNGAYDLEERMKKQMLFILGAFCA